MSRCHEHDSVIGSARDQGQTWTWLHAVLQDSLTPVHQYVEAVLGPEHPVAMEMRQLAAANESPAIRAARAEKQRVMEVRTGHLTSKHDAEPADRALVVLLWVEMSCVAARVEALCHRRAPASLKNGRTDVMSSSGAGQQKHAMMSQTIITANLVACTGIHSGGSTRRGVAGQLADRRGACGAARGRDAAAGARLGAAQCGGHSRSGRRRRAQPRPAAAREGAAAQGSVRGRRDRAPRCQAAVIHARAALRARCDVGKQQHARQGMQTTLLRVHGSMGRIFAS